MSDINYVQLFKIAGFVFLASLGVLLYLFTNTQASSRKFKIIARLCAVASFIAMFIFVVANAKTDPRLAYQTHDGAVNNDIYNILFYATTFVVRTVIFGFMVFAFLYLLRKSLQYPTIAGIRVHQLLLILGIIGVSFVFITDITDCLKDRDYAERISFGRYGIIFIGSMFWMMICSMVAAAALPEDYKTKKQN
jgi:hypothetical protein